MKIKYTRILLVTLFLLFSACSFSQRFDSILNKLDKEYPQEKLYLHFDRPLYYSGETIWFKAYLYSGTEISLISKTLYTELIDESGTILDRKTAPILESTGAGSFDIPLNVRGKHVFIRAYTRWMLNFDTAFLFVKSFPLLSKKMTASTTSIPPQYNLEFFPEGGDLIDGVTSRIAFKATDQNGFPVKIQGDIMDGSSKKIDNLKTIHDGMGVFEFHAEAGKQGKASWKDPLGNYHETNLPAVKSEGVVLEIKPNGKKLDFKITRSSDTLNRYNEIYIVAQGQQQLAYRAKARLAVGAVLNGNIPTDQLPTGILQVTLFDKFQQPLAERIVFVNNQEYYFITDLNAAASDFGKRKKNVLQIDVPDTLRCNLSVAVTDADLNSANKYGDDIISHLLLTSDIHGYVNNPGYYFESDADSVAKQLDLVMMTNGWRRFKWEDVLNAHFPTIRYKPENFLSIEGKVYGIPKGSMVNQELTGILELKNKNKHILNAPVRNDGTFSIPGLIFYDTAHVYYQFNNDKDKRLTSRASFELKTNLLSRNISVPPGRQWGLPFNNQDSVLVLKNKEASDRFISDAEHDQKVKVLSTIEIHGRQKSKKELMDEEYTSGFFRGGDDIAFIMDDESSSGLTVLSYLQGRVAGLDIKMNSGEPTLSWRGGTPTIFLNEIENDVQSVETIPLSDVAMIKVFRPPFFGAMGGGAGGAIAIYLKKGASANGNVRGLDFSAIEGYSTVKEFYSPDYSKADQYTNQEDYRSTLYWNPFVLTDKDHRKIFLNFYNNDITKKIRVIVEGINEEGRLTRIEKVFQ